MRSVTKRRSPPGPNPTIAEGRSQPREGLAHYPSTQSFVGITALIASTSILPTQRIRCKRQTPDTILTTMDRPTSDAVPAESFVILLVKTRRTNLVINSISWKMDAIDMDMQCRTMPWRTSITIPKLGVIPLMGKSTNSAFQAILKCQNYLSRNQLDMGLKTMSLLRRDNRVLTRQEAM